MKQLLVIKILASVLLFLTGCSTNEDVIPEEIGSTTIESKTNLDEELSTESKVDSLKKHFQVDYVIDRQLNWIRGPQISLDWDTIFNSKVQLIRDWRVVDIFRKDSLTYLRISVRDNFYTFPLTKQVLSEIRLLASKDERFYRKRHSDLILLVSLSELKRMDHLLIAYSDEDPDYPSAYVDWSSEAGPFFVAGELIQLLTLQDEGN